MIFSTMRKMVTYKETLIALVCGLPRLTAELRHNILRNMTALAEDERHELLSSPDSMLVWNCISNRISSTQRNITTMFESFRRTKTLKLNEAQKKNLKEEMTRIGTKISETHLLLFDRLKERQFSRKDHAGLLCCPNAGRSLVFPALDVLFPATQNPSTNASDGIDDAEDSDESHTTHRYKQAQGQFNTPIRIRPKRAVYDSHFEDMSDSEDYTTIPSPSKVHVSSDDFI
ncbi:hypothetical protein BLNAU_18862 [Blattamonas nauphoetae]|uniref:Uncharacterized protein n=1 Tax=Blattamonas nauphoetae TaxID=2049346 RepID=A0ABQ9X349_9EUKA|nr:hypothetical protein BLNAU_18862 [Blattamonas nauphoetae]